MQAIFIIPAINIIYLSTINFVINLSFTICLIALEQFRLTKKDAKRPHFGAKHLEEGGETSWGAKISWKNIVSLQYFSMKLSG